MTIRKLVTICTMPLLLIGAGVSVGDAQEAREGAAQAAVETAGDIGPAHSIVGGTGSYPATDVYEVRCKAPKDPGDLTSQCIRIQLCAGAFNTFDDNYWHADVVGIAGQDFKGRGTSTDIQDDGANGETCGLTRFVCRSSTATGSMKGLVSVNGSSLFFEDAGYRLIVECVASNLTTTNHAVVLVQNQ